jgi:cellobiose-specific phosphotransferase system component IIC
MSIPEFARTTPVTPPIVNKNINPKAKRIGAFISIELPHNVASQLKTLIPVGIAITMVAAVKYALVSISNPTVYM